jgi:uncharacterized membrane protein (DUF485 family)
MPLLRPFLFWLLLLLLAVLFGAARDFLLSPLLGDALARALGTIALCAVMFVLIRIYVARSNLHGTRRLLGLGLFWTVLTLAFEFGLGRAQGIPWAEMLADYDILAGRLWPLVPLTLLLGPLLARHSLRPPRGS